MSVETSNAPKHIWIAPFVLGSDDWWNVTVGSHRADYEPMEPEDDSVGYVRRDLVVPTVGELAEMTTEALRRTRNSGPTTTEALHSLLLSRIEGDNDELA